MSSHAAAAPPPPQLSLPLTSTTALAGIPVVFLLYLLLARPTRLVRWLGRKRYQAEITFSLYMLTPTEKFIANSALFLILSMILIACALYLPEHVTTISRRVFYYIAGDVDGATPAGSLGSASVMKETLGEAVAATVRPVAAQVSVDAAKAAAGVEA